MAQERTDILVAGAGPVGEWELGIDLSTGGVPLD